MQDWKNKRPQKNEGDSMKISCPHCQRTLDIPDELPEERVKCPLCRKCFFIQMICAKCNTSNPLISSCTNCGDILISSPMISVQLYEPPKKIQMAPIIKRLLFLLGLVGLGVMGLRLCLAGNDNAISIVIVIGIGGALTALAMLVYSILVFCNIIPDSKNLIRLTRNTGICMVCMTVVCGGIAWYHKIGESSLTSVGRSQSHWDSEAYRIFMELQSDRESIIDCIVIIDDWNKNSQHYTSQVNNAMPIPSDEIMFPFRRYKLAMNYLIQKIMTIAPKYVTKDKKTGELEVKKEIFIRVMRLCGSETY